MILSSKISKFEPKFKKMCLNMTFDQQYDKELEALFVRFPSVQQASFGDAYKPGFQGMRSFDALLGAPHRSYRTIHIAGTNGKGSVANLLASALSACGLKVGLYTSPHILDFRERMRVAAPGREPLTEMVSKEYVLDFITRWKADFDRLDLSFFEITTGMAFAWFEQQQVDVAVVESGLGGRLDSTNIITPDLSIVTSIGLDHCDLLGHTLEAIAAEKAGIFKPGVPALVGEVTPETFPVFSAKAMETDSDFYIAENEFPPFWEESEYILREMDLQGAAQAKNLRTVLTALDILGIHDRALVEGLVHTAARMDFHGRWERISTQPDVLCDIGHNAAALQYNFAQLQHLVAEGVYSSLIIVYGIMADKDLDAILPLLPRNATYIFTTPSNRRALPGGAIRDRFAACLQAEGLGTGRLYVCDPVRDAVEMAVRLAAQTWNPDGKPLIYIGGSTFVVTEAVPCFPASRQGR